MAFLFQQTSLSDKMTNGLMMAVMTFLLVTFLLSCFFYVLNKCFPRSLPSSFHATQIRFVLATDQGSTSSCHGGLDPDVIQELLPSTTFRSEDFKDGLDCAVCLAELSDGEEARVLPTCGHGFHVECIDMWLRYHDTCPVCRSLAVPEPTPQVLMTGCAMQSCHLVDLPGQTSTSFDDSSSSSGSRDLVIDIPQKISNRISAVDT